MRITATNIDGEELCLTQVTQLSLDDSVEAACAALSLTCLCEETLGEVTALKAYDGEALIFNGLCDLQRETRTGQETECFLYARSTAALLVDNEALPFTYRNPTAVQLFCTYAAELGFSHQLPNLSYEALYEVPKGSSCFGAVNQFVTLLTGRGICVTPDNTVRLLAPSEEVVEMRRLPLLSVSRVTDRSDLLSDIRYKRDAGETEYALNVHAGISDSIRLQRRRFVNLGATPRWQRDFTVSQQLRKSYERYQTLEVTVDGYVGEALMTRFLCDLFGGEEEYLLYEKRYTETGGARRTRLRLMKNNEIGEMTYVD